MEAEPRGRNVCREYKELACDKGAFEPDGGTVLCVNCVLSNIVLQAGVASP